MERRPPAFVLNLVRPDRRIGGPNDLAEVSSHFSMAVGHGRATTALRARKTCESSDDQRCVVVADRDHSTSRLSPTSVFGIPAIPPDAHTQGVLNQGFGLEGCCATGRRGCIPQLHMAQFSSAGPVPQTRRGYVGINSLAAPASPALRLLLKPPTISRRNLHTWASFFDSCGGYD